MTSANKTGETKRESKAEYGRNGVEEGGYVCVCIHIFQKLEVYLDTCGDQQPL